VEKHIAPHGLKPFILKRLPARLPFASQGKKPRPDEKIYEFKN